MAYTTATSHFTLPGLAGFATALGGLVERINRYRMYQRTLAELSNVSARDLADLGFSRSNLRAAAYEAVYGSQTK